MPDADQLLLGSLCTGYGGLDLACRDTLGTRTAWVAENDPHAAKVCRARFKAPNLGDIKTIDWTTIQPIDVLTAGYPCQPFSHAGKRRGSDDPRHIWPYIAEGVRHLRPRLVVLENVAGHLTTGFGEVVGTLAAMGYDATWGCVRASDAGGCHQRKRVFIVAADADGAGPQGRRGPVERPRELVASPRDPSDHAKVKLLPTPTVNDSRGGRNITANRFAKKDTTSLGWTLSDVAFADRWGEYAEAIKRWEPIVGRSVPEPVDAKGRLSPVFVEWMMGLPAGWVTAVTNYPKVNVSGEKLARSHMLKILGNGVVPQQATLALHHLLPRL